MTKQIYTVLDKVAGVIIGSLIQEPSDPPAVRAFRDALTARESQLSKHPEDYDLLCVGMIDERGLLLPVLGECPRVVVTGASITAVTEGTDRA